MYYNILNDDETSRYNRRVVSFRKTPKLYPKCGYVYNNIIIIYLYLLYTYICKRFLGACTIS